MEIITLSFFIALAKFMVLANLFGGTRKLVYWDKWIDGFCLLILPIPFLGTYSGAMLAIFSGIWISFFLLVARLTCGSQQPDFLRKRHAKGRHANAEDRGSNCLDPKRRVAEERTKV